MDDVIDTCDIDTMASAMSIDDSAHDPLPPPPLDPIRDTLTVEWVERYLNHGFSDICTFSRLYRLTFSDQPWRNRMHHEFMSSLPPLKYKWEWMADSEKQTALEGIRAHLEPTNA